MWRQVDSFSKQRDLRPAGSGEEGGCGLAHGPPRAALQVLGQYKLPSSLGRGHPTDLVVLSQHMALFLPADGLGAGVLGSRKAMRLRGHGVGLRPASPGR